MSLSPETRLGSYEIVAPLGAGGMGEVHRATDHDLKRDVAIKVLPPGVVGDAERLARFRREAELLAALNHSNVAQIHGLTRTPDGAPALVMELVDGPTLADVIARGPLPSARAIEIAAQIADGLDAAHEAGVVHRDLKPANVKVRGDGVVKILDFGLARSTSHPPDAAGAATITSPAVSTPGVVLGTAAYMSSEQARGQVADARSDIWAFGCVVFEMLTGRRAFDGATIADVTAAVLDREPDWAALPASAPEPVRRVLRRCLAKDRRRRYGAISDVSHDLVDGPLGARAPLPPPEPRVRPVWSMIAAAVGGAALAALAALAARPAPSTPPVDLVTASTVFANGGQLNLGHGGLAFAPDGRSLYLEVMTPDRRDTQVWRRALDEDAAVPVRGTEGGRVPSVSPDGRWLAFTAGGKLLKVPAEGGAPTVLADAPHMHGAAWSRDVSHIFYAPTGSSGIWRVPAAGGEPAAVTELNRLGGDIAHEWPLIAPDGRLVYVRNGQQRPFDDSHVVALDLGTGTSTILARNAFAPRFDDAGHLFTLDRSGSVSVTRFGDRGDGPTAVSIARFLPWMGSGTAAYAIGPGGLVAFAPEVDRSQRQIAEIGPDGRPEELSPKRAFLSLAASPDGERLAATTVGGILLIGSNARREWSQLPQTAFSPALLWTRGGQELLYAPSLGRLERLRPGGGVTETAATAGDGDNLTPATWHPESGRLLIRRSGAPGLWSWNPDTSAFEPLRTFEQLPIVHAAAEPRRGLVAIATDFTGVSVRTGSPPSACRPTASPWSRTGRRTAAVCTTAWGGRWKSWRS